MKISDTESASMKDRYCRDFGPVDTKSGFSLTVSKSQKGNYVVTKWYQRSSWVDDEKEHEVVYSPELTIVHQAPVFPLREQEGAEA